MSILIFIIALMGLILAHEFGHFIAAKKSDIRVTEFGIGLPPKLFKIQKGETQYSFNLLPFGGFVKIQGEEGEERDDPRSFSAKPVLTRIWVLSAGVFFNLILAWLLFSVGFMIGMPVSASSVPEDMALNKMVVITQVQEGTPAEQAGLMSGDELVTFASSEDVQSFISQNRGVEINISYVRKGETFSAQVTPAVSPEEGVGSLGIAMEEIVILRSPWYSAFWDGLKATYEMTIAFAVGITRFIIDAINGLVGIDKVMGPVGIVKAASSAASFGLSYLLGFIAMISVNLAVINLFPLPALDGGRILFLLIEKVKGSPVNPKISGIVHGVGLALLLLLMLVITYNDVIKLF